MSMERANKDVQAPSTTKRPANQPETADFDSGNILDLQRTLGNQAVQRLMAEGRLNVGGNVLQAKLTVGPVDDVYEQEADKTAKQVMNMPDPVQRAAEEDELQMKSIQRASPEEEEPLQAKSIQRAAEEDELQMKPIQRAAEEDELQMKSIQRAAPEEDELLQAKSAEAETPEVTSELEGQIEGMRGSGQAMPGEAQSFFENRFGQDFSNVNIHTGSEADTVNRSISARAFTTGSDIYFRSGEYNPDSSGGRELLAHELTHVVQQGGSQAKRKPEDGES